MAITEERLKEMEEEMNRFEEEISSVQPLMGLGRGRGRGRGGPPKMIIGSNTYHQVQARLGSHGEEPPGRLMPREAGQQNLPFAAGPPPPPPPPDMPGPAHPQGNTPLRPPPPPPLGNPPGPPGPRPAFVPPQLRSRPPPPPRPPFPPQNMHHPSRPPMGPPRGMPPPPPMGGPPMGMPPPPNAPPNMGPYSMYPQGGGAPQGPVQPRKTLPVIEKPKIVYSAAPVRNIPKVEPEPEKVREPEVSKLDLPEKKVEPEVMPSAGSATQPQPEETGSAQPLGMPYHVTPQGMMPMDVDGDIKKEKKEKKKKFVRMAAGTQWEDNSLSEWDQDDFRIFCGDLGNEVTEEVLARAFSRYPSFQKSRVVRDKRTNKTRGYGFVSFKDPNDFVRAMREMNGKYVGNRPIKLRKSAWKDRQADLVKKKDREKKRLGFR